MIENKFISLFVTFLWLTGGFGVLLSLLYMGQYRRRNWWSIGNTVSVPRTLVPLYTSLLLFCSGLALFAYTMQLAQTVWMAIGWGLLGALFAIQSVLVIVQAFEEGWDTPLATLPTEGGISSRLLSAIATIVLLSNGGLLSWWGAGQYEAGRFDTAFFWRDQRIPATPSEPTLVPVNTGEQIAQSVTAVTGESTVGNDAGPSVSENAATANSATELAAAPTVAAAEFGALAGIAPAIVTVAPPGLQVTPTAAAVTARTGLATERPDAENATTPSAAVLGDTALLTATVAPTVSVPISDSTQTVAITDTTAIDDKSNESINSESIDNESIETTQAEVAATATPQPLRVRSALGANVRRAPSLNGQIILTLANNRAAVAIGRNTAGDWLQIRLPDGTTGWISAALTSLSSSTAGLPVIEP